MSVGGRLPDHTRTVNKLFIPHWCSGRYTHCGPNSTLMTGSLQLTPLIRYLETGWSFFLLSGKCFPFHPVPLHPNCLSFLNFLFSHSEKAKKFKCWTHQEALSSCFHFCIKGTHDCVPSNPLNIRRYSEGKASYYLPGRAMLRGHEPTAKGSQPPFSFLEGV